MRARVVFKDGTEIKTGYSEGHWSPAVALTVAITAAEISKGEAHAGAWLEFEAK